MSTDPKPTGLSGNEIYCMGLKGLMPSGVVIGNSIQSMGFLGEVTSELRSLGGNSEFLFVGSGGFDLQSTRAGG